MSDFRIWELTNVKKTINFFIFQIVKFLKLFNSENFQILKICRTIKISKTSNLVNYHIYYQITKDELFDGFIIEYIFFILYKLFEQKYLIIFQIVKYRFSKFLDFENSSIFQVKHFRVFEHFPDSSIIENWEIG